MAGLYSTTTIAKWRSQVFEAPVEKITVLQGSAFVLYGTTHTLVTAGESATVNSPAIVVVSANNSSCNLGVTMATGF